MDLIQIGLVGGAAFGVACIVAGSVVVTWRAVRSERRDDYPEDE